MIPRWMLSSSLWICRCPDGDHGRDGCFVFANGHTLDIVGKAEDVCIGKTLASLISVSRRPRFNRSGKAPVLFTREGRFYEVDGISRFHTKSDTFELSRIHDVTSTYRDKEMLEFLKSDAPIGIFQFVMDEHFSFFLRFGRVLRDARVYAGPDEDGSGYQGERAYSPRPPPTL